jgi:hypothetical protein
MLKSTQIILAIATYFDYKIWQMGVKITFLNGNLTEDMYITQPEVFVDPTNARKICKLHKYIYGLRKHLEVVTFTLMKWSKGLASFRVKKNLVFTRRQVGDL